MLIRLFIFFIGLMLYTTASTGTGIEEIQIEIAKEKDAKDESEDRDDIAQYPIPFSPKNKKAEAVRFGFCFLK